MTVSEPRDLTPECGPFLHGGSSPFRMMLLTLVSLMVLAAIYSSQYGWWFMVRWCECVAMGAGLELAVMFVGTGRLRLRSGGSMLTAALLIMSVPPAMELKVVAYGLVAAVVVTRMGRHKSMLPLNPMLVGRLFLMLCFADQMATWAPVTGGDDLDALTGATPLDLFQNEGAILPLSRLFWGPVHGSWEDAYTLLPGSPGEMYAPIIIGFGLVLCWLRVLAWRQGVAFVVTFCLAILVLGQPLWFNLFSGSIFFAAVYIAGDPSSSPASRGGQIAFGVIAGVANALIRVYTYYPEGIVFAFLAVNILTPILDRAAFIWRGWRLRRSMRITKRP